MDVMIEVCAGGFCYRQFAAAKSTLGAVPVVESNFS